MITKQQSAITEADLIGCIATRGHADGTVTLYFEGDTIPDLPAAPEVPMRYITAKEYRDRFTTPELLAMLNSTDAGVKLLVLKVSTAPPEGIDLRSQTVADGLAYLVSNGILLGTRPSEIVA